MTPILSVRSFSTDQFVLDKVLYANSYSLRASKDLVAVDVGAHCGYFTFASLGVGFGIVYAFEPFIENYKVLLKNIESTAITAVRPYNLAVYTEGGFIKFNYPIPQNGVNFDFANIEIEQDNGSPYFVCPCFTLDNLLTHVVQEPSVHLLKINMGYAEVEVLKASKLEKVQAICGETEHPESELDSFKVAMSQKGFLDIRMETSEGISSPRTKFFMARGNLDATFLFKN